MISPAQMALAIRRDLAASVLPAVTDGRARSSVIAAIGILGDLALQIREDDAWLAESVTVLTEGVRRWPVTEPPPTPDLRTRRNELLEVIADLMARIWRGKADRALLPDVRSVLQADLEMQLKRIR